MPIFFLQFEVQPKKTNADRNKFGGAVVNCWILRDTQRQAEVVARGWIGDQNWLITHANSSTLMTKEEQLKYPEGIRYFEQAEIDHEVFVFHTWPIGKAQ